MDSILPYLLKVSAGTMLFYFCYILFFSKDTFYLRNRIFLIGLLLLSIIIPLLNLFNIFAAETTSGYANPVNMFIISGTNIGATVSEKITSYDLSYIFIGLYFLITGVFLVRAIVSVVRTLTIIRSSVARDKSFPMVILTDLEHPPFSFFPYVVIPRKTFENGDCAEILAHEKAHVRQGHTFDLLLSELMIVFLWFNPFIWLIKRSMVLNHEYMADNFSLKSSGSIKEYQYKLLNIPHRLMNVPLAHNFSSLIKNRIIMINKKPSRNYAALKNIIIIPVVAILFIMFSFKPESGPGNNGYQTNQFSKTSESEILKFMAVNTGYPQEAKSTSDTGSIYVMIKMNKGGSVKECKAFTEKKGINVPFLEEIVIVGNKPAGATSSAKSTVNEHAALKTECLRVARKLAEVKIPEWKDKDMEFAVPVKFILK